MIVRPAKLSDVDSVFALVNFYAKAGKLLKRPKRDVKKNIRSFFVAVINNAVVGCVSLEVYSRKMAEMRSLAVKQGATRSGVGKALVAACIARARKRKILEVMVISSEEHFFRKLGFNYTLPGERKALFLNP